MWAPGSHAGSGSSLSIRESRTETTPSASQVIWLTRSSRCSTTVVLRWQAEELAHLGVRRVRVDDVEPHRRDAERLGAADVRRLVVEEDHVGEGNSEALGEHLVEPG